jgi:hypothetical protein
MDPAFYVVIQTDRQTDVARKREWRNTKGALGGGGGTASEIVETPSGLQLQLQLQAEGE